MAAGLSPLALASDSGALDHSAMEAHAKFRLAFSVRIFSVY